VVVAPGRNGSLHPYGYQFATGWIVPPGYRLTQATEYDVGLVVLPDSTYGATLGWFTVGVVSDATLYASAFIAPGYDEDALPAYSMVLRGGGFSSVTLTRLNFLSSATHGASGAPILRASDSLLLGVLQGGTDGSGPVGPPNYGRRVDTDVTAFLADGCTILACTFSAYVEPSPITPTSTPIPAPASATPTAIATRSPTPTPTPIARLRIYVPVALR
jgi:V8-like Glu-specific endopeptidase